MERATFKTWLEAYGRAWEARDAHAATALFAEDGTYQVTPFVAPMRGHEAIFQYWSDVTRPEQNIQFGFEILALTSDAGIARWWASFVRVPPGLKTRLDGIFLISLDAHNRCKSLREWWHKEED